MKAPLHRSAQLSAFPGAHEGRPGFYLTAFHLTCPLHPIRLCRVVFSFFFFNIFFITYPVLGTLEEFVRVGHRAFTPLRLAGREGQVIPLIAQKQIKSTFEFN